MCQTLGSKKETEIRKKEFFPPECLWAKARKLRGSSREKRGPFRLM